MPPIETSIMAEARRCVERGLLPIPVRPGSKKPLVEGWPALRLTAADLPRHFSNGANLGVLLGDPASGLVDVDLDTAEAIAAAPEFLPPTNQRHGRPGAPESHWWYLADGMAPPPATWEDPDGTMLVELRSTGQQTVIPPSFHPSGERLAWSADREPARVDPRGLRVVCARLAACALLARHWPVEGSRHTAALAAAGLLLRGGISEGDAIRLVGTAARIADDPEVEDRERAVGDTAVALAEGGPATGGAVLGELIGAKVVARLTDWLNLAPPSSAPGGGPKAAQKPAGGPPWALYDAAEDWNFPPPERLIDVLLPLIGVVWIGGMPKRFKSLLLLYVCLVVACKRGTVAKQFKVMAYPRILYVAREDGGSRLKSRRDDILAAWGTRPEPGALQFAIRPRIDLLNPAHVALLRDTCVAEGRTVLVLDTWTALSPSADPMAARDQAALAAAVVALAEDINGLVIVVDHTRKNRPEGQPLSSAEIFGPQQKWAAAEHIVMLDVVGERRIEVFIEGKDTETVRCFLDVAPEGAIAEKFTYAGSAATVVGAQRAVGDRNRQRVYGVLVAAAGAWLSSGEIAARAEMSDDTAARHARALAEVGLVGQTGKGKATRFRALGDSPQTADSPQTVGACQTGRDRRPEDSPQIPFAENGGHGGR